MKSVLITGASHGIGKECAKRFAREGFFVYINYFKSEKEVKELEKYITENGGQCALLKGDVSKKSDVCDMFLKIKKITGGADVLVNNAGISKIKMLCDTDEDEYNEIFDVNMKSVYLCCREAIGYMVHNKYGRIINVSSMWGVSGASCESVYSASKAAVIGFTKAIAKELAPSGISVNAVAPGVIDTKMNASLTKEEKDELASQIPAGRFGTAFEVSDLIYNLAGENSAYITGQVILIDGGFLG